MRSAYKKRGGLHFFLTVDFNAVREFRLNRDPIRVAGIVKAKLTHVAVTFVLQANNHHRLPLQNHPSSSGTAFFVFRCCELEATHVSSAARVGYRMATW